MLAGQLRSIVAWSRILADHEILAAINTDLDNPRTAWVTIDHGLHQEGDTLACSYSTEPATIGADRGGGRPQRQGRTADPATSWHCPGTTSQRPAALSAPVSSNQPAARQYVQSRTSVSAVGCQKPVTGHAARSYCGSGRPGHHGGGSVGAAAFSQLKAG